MITDVAYAKCKHNTILINDNCNVTSPIDTFNISSVT